MPWLRTLLSHVIMAAFPLVAKKWGCVVKVSSSGEVLDVLLDPNGDAISTISAVSEHGGRLYFGNLGGDSVAVLQL